MTETVNMETKEERKLLIPKIDVVFHSLFRTSKERITSYFISSLLQTKVKVLTMDKDRHLVKKYPDEKLGILDLRTELEGIEELGGKWKIILDEEGSKRVLTDKLELVILEIPKARRIIKKEKDNKIAQWLMFLDNPNSQEVTRIMEENKEIKEAVEELDEMSQDEELKRLAFLKEKYIRDERSAQRYFREQGLEEGREEGRKEGRTEQKVEIAKKMLKEKMKIEVISRITGLSEEEIKNL